MKKVFLVLLFLFSLNIFAQSELRCFGTEPFFSASITENTFAFTLIGLDGISLPIESKTNAHGTRDFAYKVKSQGVEASIITGECNDGMSDRVYSHHILIEIGKNIYYGCCNRVK